MSRVLKRICKIGAAIASGLVLAIGFADLANASIVLENPWNPAALDEGAFSQSSQQLAGKFVLGAAAIVDRATWYGTMFSPDPLDTGDTWDFNLIFYADGGGLPGAVLANIPVTASVIDTGVNVDDERAYQFDASFGAIALAGATPYWFSTLNAGALSTFRWTEATAGLDSAISHGFGWSLWTEEDRTPLNFALHDSTGSNGGAVPEPFSLFTWGGLATASLIGIRRTRREARERAASQECP